MIKPLKAFPLLGILAILVSVSITACTKQGTDVIPSKPSDTTKPVTPPPPVADSFQLRDTGVSIITMPQPVGNMSQYLQYIPAGYNDKKTYKWPLVFFLHGVGEMGYDASILKSVGLCKVAPGKPFIVIAPQAHANWWNNDALVQFYQQIIKQYHVDTSRIYLTGLSMGGYGTWTLAISHPKWFAALVPISGGGDSSQVKVLKNVPVWDFHNADDPTVAVQNSRMMVAALKAAGGNVQYTENPTGGHDAWTKAYASADLYTWMLAQKKP
ncbi:phospholipase [Chitinophaga parva]|uniref:Phospholipase n=1 Tax=Chitinophaga parva TaxID=2169414 RepID=A0A2T7BNI1_9BACT|nr:prolyl oligopeptidase family serine peptidase [Chitinophaga parva]PUZ29200.1 phospholipase [Chitinophaga parva]